MNFQFTFKKMDSSQSLMDLADQKVGPKVAAFSGPCINPHFTFSADRGMQKIHFSMLTSDGYRIEVSHSGPDMYAEMDEIAKRIESQLRRHKEKNAIRKGAEGLKAAAANLPPYQHMTVWDDVLDDETPMDATDVIKLENSRRGASWQTKR